MLLSVLVLASFVAAPLAFFIARAGAAGLVTLLPVALFAAFASLLPGVTGGEVILEEHSWIPSLGVPLSFRVDGLSLLFSLLITGIGSCVFLYAATYLKDHQDRPKFFAYLSLFMGAMLGAVLADNLVVLLVFWELTSITSFLLIGFEHEKPQARRSAQQGLLVTVGGGLALTAGIIMLGNAAGSYRIDEILSQGASIAAHPTSWIAILLIAAGAFTKSAQTPLHFWLPNAMVAPTPVSAYLHSATMVKLGVYLLARLDPLYGGHDVWMVLLVSAGLLTMLTSAVLVFRETDLKRVLAYSTLTALGTLVLLIGLPHSSAAIAMATFLVVHALYKACLFLVAGAIDHETGTRDSSQLHGLVKVMPLTAIVAMLSGLSMAGLPPFFGFIGKELVYEANLNGPLLWLIVGITLFANAATIVAAAIVALRCFWGPLASTPQHPHDPPFAMLLGPTILALLGLGFGLAPSLIERLIGAVADSVTGEEVTVHLMLWHGVTTMLKLSLATVALGVLGYLAWVPIRRWLSSRNEIDQFGPNAIYDRAMVWLVQVATWQTQRLQSGSLHTYLAATMATITIAGAISLVVFNSISLPTVTTDAIQPILVLPVLLVCASIAVVRAKSFMAGIAAAGMVGFLMSLVYLFQGAPDLAFTQFSVEALSVVVILTIAGRMPMHAIDQRTVKQRRRDLCIAGGFGLFASLLLLSITAMPFNSRLSDFYKAASYVEAHGRNIVNVIIVDFRGLDTLGEVTVLTLAATAALALLFKMPPKKRRSEDEITSKSEVGA